MISIPLEDLYKKVPGMYQLTILSFKRAQQLLEGAKPLVPTDHDRLTTIVLKEIVANKVSIDTDEKK